MESTDTLQTPVSIRDIMTSQVHTLHMDDSLRTATSLFERERFHHVVIVERGRVRGVVSDRDILKATSPFVNNPMLERPQDASTLKKRIHQIMTRKPVTVGPAQSVAAAADLMLSQRVSCLPVVDEDGALLGILTVRDLLGQLAAIRAHS
jgi:acetoin utilization protein AcuB